MVKNPRKRVAKIIEQNMRQILGYKVRQTLLKNWINAR